MALHAFSNRKHQNFSQTTGHALFSDSLDSAAVSRLTTRARLNFATLAGLIGSVRQDMLEEAIELIRRLWQGKQQSHYGNFYTVENARIYTLPDKLPPIYIAGGGPK